MGYALLKLEGRQLKSEIRDNCAVDVFWKVDNIHIVLC